MKGKDCSDLVFCGEHGLVREGDACACMELHGLELHSLSVELGTGAGGRHGPGAGGWLASKVGGCKQLPLGCTGGWTLNQDVHGWHFFTE